MHLRSSIDSKKQTTRETSRPAWSLSQPCRFLQVNKKQPFKGIVCVKKEKEGLRQSVVFTKNQLNCRKMVHYSLKYWHKASIFTLPHLEPLCSRQFSIKTRQSDPACKNVFRKRDYSDHSQIRLKNRLIVELSRSSLLRDKPSIALKMLKLSVGSSKTLTWATKTQVFRLFRSSC